MIHSALWILIHSERPGASHNRADCWGLMKMSRIYAGRAGKPGAKRPQTSQDLGIAFALPLRGVSLT
jgi:hypothetical protein